MAIWCTHTITQGEETCAFDKWYCTKLIHIYNQKKNEGSLKKTISGKNKDLNVKTKPTKVLNEKKGKYFYYLEVGKTFLIIILKSTQQRKKLIESYIWQEYLMNKIRQEASQGKIHMTYMSKSQYPYQRNRQRIGTENTQ